MYMLIYFIVFSYKSGSARYKVTDPNPCLEFGRNSPTAEIFVGQGFVRMTGESFISVIVLYKAGLVEFTHTYKFNITILIIISHEEIYQFQHDNDRLGV